RSAALHSPRKQERALDSDDAVPCVRLARPGGSRDRAPSSARVLRQAPDRPADALVRAMARPGTAGAGSGWSRTRPIHPAPFRAPLTLHVIIRNALGLGFGLSISWVQESESCGQRLAGDCRRRTRENGRNSVRRPRHASLTGIRTDGHRPLPLVRPELAAEHIVRSARLRQDPFPAWLAFAAATDCPTTRSPACRQLERRRRTCRPPLRAMPAWRAITNTSDTER